MAKQNIYSRKQIWKLVLAFTALVIVASSFWYTNVLVSKIEKEERQNVKMWAAAIRKKANLVRYTNQLFKKLNSEERKKVELWAEATRRLANADDNTDYTFILKVVSDNTTVPVILTNAEGKIIANRNLSVAKPDSAFLEQQIKLMKSINDPIEINIYGNKKNYLYYLDSKLFSELKGVLDDLVESLLSEMVTNSASVPVIITNDSRSKILSSGNVDQSIINDSLQCQALISEMASHNDPITIDLDNGRINFLYYQDSVLLKQLKYYPFFQFGIIGMFILIAYWLFSMARKTEQNQVWVGMAKETAHQLGTPLSSLMAWLELLKDQGIDASTADEIDKDIKRLEMITDRFSKIGSVPKLEPQNVQEVVDRAVNYLRTRTSDKVDVQINHDSDPNLQAQINISLFEWVIENLFKNAVDAMGAQGKITITISNVNQHIYIDLADTGSGMAGSKMKTVFEPGFTTKKRGWGLGLSLAKRIIENYHDGKIFVKQSVVGEGTTFRIVLNR